MRQVVSAVVSHLTSPCVWMSGASGPRMMPYELEYCVVHFLLPTNRNKEENPLTRRPIVDPQQQRDSKRDARDI
eukprot:scaffold46400_cov56-Attheya_sp.AAC.1